MIAKKLNRSRTGVDKVIAQMIESGEIAEKPAVKVATETSLKTSPDDSADGHQDTLGRLRWVRGVLERQLYDAEPTTAARLAKEYRDTLTAIDKIESCEGNNDIVDMFADAIAAKLG